MAKACTEVLVERKRAFDEAKKGIDSEVVTQIMKGLPVPGEAGDPILTRIRQTWSRYHECL
jgi:hypothetical protein